MFSVKLVSLLYAFLFSLYPTGEGTTTSLLCNCEAEVKKVQEVKNKHVEF